MKKDPQISWTPKPIDSLDLQGQKAIVVGGTGGLGRAITQVLVARGANVVVVGQTFRDAGRANIEFVKADLSSMVEAQRVAEALPAENADILLFTAGIFASKQRQESKEGLELDMAVSYLNRLVMLREMGPRLGRHRPAGSIRPRVFNMAYPGSGQKGTPDDLNAERRYKAMPQHMNTVAGNEILVLDAVKHYPDLDAFGLNPGLVKTNIRNNLLGSGFLFGLIEAMIGLFTPTPDQYAAKIVPLLVTPDIEGRSGAMFDKNGRAIMATEGLTEDYNRAFLAASDALVARTGVRIGS